MVTDAERQAIVDGEDLWLLPVFYWVSGGYTAFFSLYFLIYVFMGVFMAIVPGTQSTASTTSSAPPALVGYFFGAIGLGGVLISGTMALLKVLAGFWIKARRRRVFCMVVAALACLEWPYGILVAVFTFIVLGRPSVRALFEAAASSVEAGGSGESEAAVSPPPESRAEISADEPPAVGE